MRHRVDVRHPAVAQTRDSAQELSACGPASDPDRHRSLGQAPETEVVKVVMGAVEGDARLGPQQAEHLELLLEAGRGPFVLEILSEGVLYSGLVPQLIPRPPSSKRPSL